MFAKLRVLKDQVYTQEYFHKPMSLYEPSHDKTNKIACAPCEDSDQPGHPPSLIRVFAWVVGLGDGAGLLLHIVGQGPACLQQVWDEWAVFLYFSSSFHF